MLHAILFHLSLQSGVGRHSGGGGGDCGYQSVLVSERSLTREGEHVTRAVFSTERFAWLPLYHLIEAMSCVFLHVACYSLSFVIAERGW